MTLGSPVATYSMEDLVAATASNRFAVARSLNELRDGGFVKFQNQRGRSSTLLFAVSDPKHSAQLFAQLFAHIEIQFPNRDTTVFPQSSDKESTGHAQLNAQLFAHIPDQLKRGVETGGATSSKMGTLALFSGTATGSVDRASDQRSDSPQRSDLDLGSGSGSPPITLDQEQIFVPSDPPVREGENLIRTGLQAMLVLGGHAPSTEPEDDPGSRKKAPPRVTADAIPDRAWAAADFFRAQLLIEQPNVWVSRQTWESGAPATATTAAKVGSRTGARLKWANEFRLLHTQDKHDWDEIARTVGWLFRQPPGPAKFVVQSPDALRAKWDRIQAVRVNSAIPRRPFQQPENRETPQFTRWEDEPK